MCVLCFCLLFDSCFSKHISEIKIVMFFLDPAVLLEFLEQQKRSPATSSLDSDTTQLSELRKKMLESAGLNDNKLPEDFTQ